MEGLAAALLELQRLTERLRRDCPWDREQTARTIVPHTVEEAYEVADAALADDDAKLLDELGDLLFQVYFLALLLQERGAGDLEQVALGVHEKLVRRHPHVFGEHAKLGTAADVIVKWEEIKAAEKKNGPAQSGLFKPLPPRLPALMYAESVWRKIKKHAPPAEGVVDTAAIAARADELDEATLGKLLFEITAACRRRSRRRRAPSASSSPSRSASTSTGSGRCCRSARPVMVIRVTNASRPLLAARF